MANDATINIVAMFIHLDGILHAGIWQKITNAICAKIQKNTPTEKTFFISLPRNYVFNNNIKIDIKIDIINIYANITNNINNYIL
jgi:hypothetical protein